MNSEKYSTDDYAEAIPTSSPRISRRWALMWTSLALVAVIGASVAFLSFSHQESDTPWPKSVTDRALMVTTNKWHSKRYVSVCWDLPNFSNEKIATHDTLMGGRSWSDSADIVFTGWNDCGPAGADIDIGRDGDANSEVGTDQPEPGENYMNLFPTSVFYRSWMAPAVGLHEFGHALGFVHEGDRPDWDPDFDNGCSGEPPASYNFGLTYTNGAYGNEDEYSIMGYCATTGLNNLSGQDRLTARFVYGTREGKLRRLADSDGDGQADLFCYDRDADGGLWVDFASVSGQYNSADQAWTGRDWCKDDTSVTHRADFNGDGMADIMCRDTQTGRMRIDYANSNGKYTETNWEKATLGWCDNVNEVVYTGDFDGDGQADLLCNNRNTGRVAIDYANNAGQFFGNDWVDNDAGIGGYVFLSGSNIGTIEIHIGDFNGDGRDDILEHRLHDGQMTTHYASSNGKFTGSPWSGRAWCTGPRRELHVGDFNGDGRDDLLCHNVVNGKKEIDYANAQGKFLAVDWSRNNGFCSMPDAKMFVGAVDQDDRDDLICMQFNNSRPRGEEIEGEVMNSVDYTGPGGISVDYANLNGEFEGAARGDWSRDTGFCMNSAKVLA